MKKLSTSNIHVCDNMGLIWLINQISKEFNNSISPNQNFTIIHKSV